MSFLDTFLGNMKKCQKQTNKQKPRHFLVQRGQMKSETYNSKCLQPSMVEDFGAAFKPVVLRPSQN